MNKASRFYFLTFTFASASDELATEQAEILAPTLREAIAELKAFARHDVTLVSVDSVARNGGKTHKLGVCTRQTFDVPVCLNGPGANWSPAYQAKRNAMVAARQARAVSDSEIADLAKMDPREAFPFFA